MLKQHASWPPPQVAVARTASAGYDVQQRMSVIIAGLARRPQQDPPWQQVNVKQVYTRAAVMPTQSPGGSVLCRASTTAAQPRCCALGAQDSEPQDLADAHNVHLL